MKKRKNGSHGFTYRSYSFVDKDPVIDRVRTIVQREGLSYSEIHTISGVSAGTLKNWFDGETRKPQYATIAAVVGSLGYQQKFVRSKPVDYEKELEKARAEIASAKT